MTVEYNIRIFIFLHTYGELEKQYKNDMGEERIHVRTGVVIIILELITKFL